LLHALSPALLSVDAEVRFPLALALAAYSLLRTAYWRQAYDPTVNPDEWDSEFKRRKRKI
jgi:hypothetical protein